MYKIQTKNIYLFFVIIYILSTLLFFAPVYFNLIYIKAISFAIILGVFLYSTPNFFKVFKHRLVYGPLLFLWCLTLFFSVFVSYLLHEQSILYGFRSIIELFPFFFYFFLFRTRFSVSQIEKVLIFFIILYVLIYFFGLYMAPTVVFDHTGGELDVNVQRGIERVKILGSGFVNLAFFMCINKYIKERKSYLLGLVAFFFILIVFSVNRQSIFFSVVLGVSMFVSSVGFLRSAIGLVLISLCCWFFLFNTTIFLKLTELTQDQFSETGFENIRIKAFLFFIFDYNESFVQVLVGNGIPHFTGSKWGLDFFNMSKNDGFYLSDVGLAKVYFYWGVIGLLLYFYLFFKVLFNKVFLEYYYAKYMLLFVFCTNLGSHGFFVNILIVSIMLYVLEFNEANKQSMRQI